MKSLLAALALLLCCALPAVAGTWDDLTPFFSTQYFTWKENDGGRRILKERGALFAIGADAGYLTDASFSLRGKTELFGGKVDYSGETQAPDSIPVDTQVIYFGSREEIDLGYRITHPSFRFEPFAGLGHRWWLRGLEDATATDGTAVSGYTERWQSLYARAGVRGELAPSRDVGIFAEAGARYPFYTGNSVDFANSGTATFRPGGRWSGFAETSVRYRKVKLALTYEGFRFRQSPHVLVLNRYYFQPESSSDIFGVSLGWAFR